MSGRVSGVPVPQEDSARFGDLLFESWPYVAHDGPTTCCAFCYAAVPVEYAREHAKWHVATMPEDQFDKITDRLAAGIKGALAQRAEQDG